MNKFLFRLSLAAALTLGAVALGSSASAQEPSSQEPAATTPPQQQAPAATRDQQTPPSSDQEPTARPQQEPNEPAANPQQNEPNMPAAGANARTETTQSFTGRVTKENGKVVLKDPVTKTSYQIDDVSKAKPFMGKQVKVTGTLDATTNTIRIDNIEPMS
jgi:uncharacterized protein DUF5818